MAGVQMFLAERRNVRRSDFFRSLQTILSDNAAPLIAINDDTLAPDTSTAYPAQPLVCVIFLPIVGSIVVQQAGESIEVGAGEIFSSYARTADSITVTNSFKESLVNFLTIVFKGNGTCGEGKSAFQLNDQELHAVFECDTLKLSIGKFAGRTDGQYKCRTDASGVFAFVIDGAFEFCNRLLQPRDGLHGAMEGCDFEALSNEAILLLIELRSIIK